MVFGFVLLVLASMPGWSQGPMLLSIHKPEGFSNAFWDDLREGARAEARAQGINLVVKGVDPRFTADPAPGQIEVIRQALASGIAALVLTPGDRLRLVGVVQEAVLAGVPVVCIDAPVESGLLSAIVASDNYQGGLMAARRMATRLGPTGKVVVLNHPSSQNKAIHDRLEAFFSGLRQFSPGVVVLSSDRSGQATLETDTLAAGGLLRDFPEAEGVYAVSGTGLTGAFRALKAAGRAGQVVLVGWDGDPETLQGVKEGLVDAVVQQDARALGRLGVRSALEALRGSPPKRSVLIPITLVTGGGSSR